MILATTLVALLLVTIALLARRLRSDLEELAWRLTAVVMLVMPLVSLLPKAEVAIRLPFVHDEPAYVQPEQGFAVNPFLLVAATAYTLVALVLLVRLAVAVAAAGRLRRHAAPFSQAFICSSLRVPVTAGLFSPAILLPGEARSWSATKLAAVLAHERAHVIRRDPLWRFIGRAAAAVCWLHPLAWLAAASIERTAEEAADREAVAVIGDRHEYAHVLLDFLHVMTDSSRRLLAAGMLDERAISARIDMILQQPHRRPSRGVTRLLLVAMIACALFVTGMTTYEAPQTYAARLTTAKEQPLTQEELLRKRDEIRNRLRKGLRTTLREFFRDVFPD